MTDSDSFLSKLMELTPWLDRSAKDELTALSELRNLFPGLSFKELIAELKKYQKVRRLSPEGFCDRLREWLEQSPRDSQERETLVRDFASLPAATVKTVARLFDLNVSSAKKDATVFATWLSTGIKPATAEELLREELTAVAQRVINLRDGVPNQLEIATIESIMAIAEEVKKKYKIVGFREFMRLIGYPPVKSTDTGPVLTKMLRQKLDTLSVDRFKAHQIESQW